MMRAEPNLAVLYPCDAVSTERLLELMAYTPGPAEFLSGAIKSNDVGLLMTFQKVFQLGG